MFCHKCGNQVSGDSAFYQNCGSKVISESTLDQALPPIPETRQNAEQATLNNAALTKTSGFRSIFRIGRNILIGFAVLLALFSLLGVVGLIIGGVIVGILVLMGWRMTVAEERKKEE